MSDIGPRDELYMVNPEGKLEKMDPGEHHLEHLMNFYPEEDDYNEEFWDIIFDGGWIRIELKENSRNGWDLAVNGKSLSRMKAIVRDNFLERLKRGENKVHIEEWTGTGMNPTKNFYLPMQKDEFYDFILEKLQAKFIYEALNFERGHDPRDSMDIGNKNMRKLKEFYNFVKETGKFQMGELKYPDFEFILTPVSSTPTFKIKIIISKNPDDGDDFIYHSYSGSDGSALSINHFQNLKELKSILKSRLRILESQNFERGLDPKKSMDLGRDALIKKIPWQLNQIDQIGPDLRIAEFISIYRGFPILVYDLGDSYQATSTMDYTGICLSSAVAVRAMKRRINTLLRKTDDKFKERWLPWNMKESQNFERGLDPKESMTIGREARIKKLDQETDWGFEISHAFQVRIWDIIKYEGFLIKISQLMGSDGIAYYMALNDTGEPYNNTPPMYDTPEEALDWEKKYIDQYNMGM